MTKFPDVDVVVNFASFRSVYESTVELLKFPQFKTIAIIAEGVPEQRTKQLIKLAKAVGVTIIGPATVRKTKTKLKQKYFIYLFIFLFLGGRHQARLLQGGQHGRHDGQHHRLQAVPPRQRCVRVQVWRHVQRAQQHHLAPHRRRVRGRGHWWRPLPRHHVHRPHPALRGRPELQDDCAFGRGTKTICETY